VVVDVVQVILQQRLLGDLPEHLVHDGVGDVVPQEVQHEAVSSTELQVLQSPCSHFSHQHGPGEVWDHDPGEPVHQADGGDSDEEEPPEPEDEEILLVEDVVVEDAQVVAPVDGSGGGADPDVAGNLCGEKFTHRVVTEIFAIWSNMFDRPDIVEHLLPVPEELVEQEGVRQQHGEEHHHQVQELAEPEVDVVLGVSHAEVKEVLADDGRVALSAQDVPDETILQEVPPEGARELGEAEAECKKEGNPEIIGSHGGVLLGLYLGLVHEAAGSLALQMFSYIGCTVDPAVRPGVLVPALADDGPPVQVVLQEDEEQPEHDHECGGLVVELEERIVYRELITFEPFEKVTDDGESVDDRGSHGGGGGDVFVVSLYGIEYYLI